MKVGAADADRPERETAIQLKISQSQLDYLTRRFRRSSALGIEDGATMIGYNQAPLFVVQSFVRGPRSVGSATAFKNDPEFEQRFLRRARRRDPRLEFVGSVHTHPARQPMPSGKDLSSARRALRHCAYLFIVIASGFETTGRTQLRAFFLARGMSRFLDAEVVLRPRDLIQERSYVVHYPTDRLRRARRDRVVANQEKP